MKSCQLLLAVVTVCALGVFSSDVRAATISITIDGETSPEVPLRWLPHEAKRGGQYVIGTPAEDLFVFETEGGKVELHGALDPDPELTFGGVAFDFGAPSVFSFTFIMPLAPVFHNPSVVLDSFSGSVTNGSAAGGVTVTALPPPAGIPVDGDGVTEMQVYTLSDDGGLTWKNVGLDNGPSAFIPLGSFESGLYGTFNQGPIPTIAGGPWTHMRADVNFSLSGGGDIFTFNGAKILIPEPGTLALASLLIGLAGCCRRRFHR